MAENRYYKEIMSLKGMNDFKDVIEQWHRLSENMRKFNAKKAPTLPNLLWASDNGMDLEDITNLLTGFVYEEQNLLDFYGAVQDLDYFMEYVPNGEEFHEIDKIAEKIRGAAGFRSEYRGIMAIDVSEWIEHFQEENFIEVLKYLQSISSDILYIFQIPNFNPQAVEQLTQILALFFHIQPIEMKLPEAAELAEYTKDLLLQYGLTLDTEAEQMLTNSVARLKEDQYFAGYTLLDRMASDIAYSIFTSTPPYDGLVTKGMITAFAPDGIYVNEMIQNNARVFTSQFNY
jgi:hypothetical protein